MCKKKHVNIFLSNEKKMKFLQLSISEKRTHNFDTNYNIIYDFQLSQMQIYLCVFFNEA